MTEIYNSLPQSMRYSMAVHDTLLTSIRGAFTNTGINAPKHYWPAHTDPLAVPQCISHPMAVVVPQRAEVRRFGQFKKCGPEQRQFFYDVMIGVCCPKPPHLIQGVCDLDADYYGEPAGCGHREIWQPEIETCSNVELNDEGQFEWPEEDLPKFTMVQYGQYLNLIADIMYQNYLNTVCRAMAVCEDVKGLGNFTFDVGTQDFVPFGNFTMVRTMVSGFIE